MVARERARKMRWHERAEKSNGRNDVLILDAFPQRQVQGFKMRLSAKKDALHE